MSNKRRAFWMEQLSRWSGPAALLIALVLLSAWLVPYYPDPILDFGREAYVPWRITEGEAIYRDIEYFNGPLSPYLHAAVFALFGVSLMTLKLFNVVLVGLGTALLYHLLRAIGDRFAATIGCLTFLSLFAFAHHQPFAIFNWITPYSYELPHGIGLSLAMIALLWKHATSRRRLYCALGGACLGLVMLTKAEVQLAAALAAVAWAICLPLKSHWRACVSTVMVFGACAAAVVLVAGLGLWAIMPLRDVLSGLAGSWKWVGDEQLHSLHYFQFILGTHDTRQSLQLMGMWTGIYAAVVALAAGVAMLPARVRLMPRRWIVLPVALVTAGGLYALNRHQPLWLELPRPMPMFMTLAGLVLLWRVYRHRDDRARLAQLALPMMLVVLAGALLGKVLLNVRLLHYGFALAMPATVLTLVWMLAHLPRAIERFGGSATAARGVITGAWAAAMIVLLAGQAQLVAFKTERVAASGDAFYADRQRAQFVNVTLHDLNLMQTPNQTLVAMPEGLLIGYLARRANPAGHLNFTPPALIMFGEERMVADLAASPPDLIVLVHVDTSVYDARFFGADYAREMAGWIRQNYQIATRVGAMPFTSERFGIMIMHRRDLSAGAAGE